MCVILGGYRVSFRRFDIEIKREEKNSGLEESGEY